MASKDIARSSSRSVSADASSSSTFTSTAIIHRQQPRFMTGRVGWMMQLKKHHETRKNEPNDPQ
ncbi:hypothetical protein CC1G_14770 [Coprinopsis cinerea okayama7|uniref:Uncharacterized protein n=1 Tax=Coprinopsis cinerea (strain Okayama-7 / 130 / ATCC MYA-4618 / FGSC 9003) TaxID=240176 RepID=D6RNT0_COPC7|nr:hypothetical protein CC1G_14770 [Coprinopsis cinerea okayama7\|eukprot:XP_002910792.1 hypothetical protein CC1G_14770 [Coprinopsis cinerea okayama7\